MGKKVTRREFMIKSALTATGVSLGATAFSANSYNNIIGANERINFAVVGVRSRGMVHIQSISSIKNATVSHICDVDQRYIKDAMAYMSEKKIPAPETEKDIRKLLESKEIDVITIATPEHWHAPMAIMAMEAGKHIYLEKPSSHNPAEGEMLLKSQNKYNKLIQMGNQQRSSIHTEEAIQKIRNGIIGTPYMGKAWYCNTRGSIGIGKVVPVPDYLDWELWQGPAPRRPYKDNVHPYNWHWFWDWGTGETLNNGTHEVDICLWALGVNFPKRVTASGGRFHYQDDWEFYDTIVTSFEYEGKQITWEGKSCNGRKIHNRGRGVTIHGTEGCVLIDRNGYEIYDAADNKIYSVYQRGEIAMGLQGGGPTTTRHFDNLIQSIKSGVKLRAPLEEGNIAVTMLQLSNIAWKTGDDLDINPANGHILDNPDAMQYWGREYEEGWEPKV